MFFFKATIVSGFFYAPCRSIQFKLVGITSDYRLNTQTCIMGSWDKTLKVWSISDLKCLESIKAHDDVINSLVACKGIVYSASADGKIKAWGKHGNTSHSLQGILEGHKDVSLNSVTVSEDGKWVYGGGSDEYGMGWEGNTNFSA
ncbi:myosin heavy chain kinase B-like [Gossypium australe]|uniref:Myosin heavy chain kinase B-like n=1 Tax=Gossypium australe TaxID=47621 RepID=A0A5B6VWE3_9ROSI|nr:myosin heavy chain kinase B-like [Gossypium australe]